METTANPDAATRLRDLLYNPGIRGEIERMLRVAAAEGVKAGRRGTAVPHTASGIAGTVILDYMQGILPTVSGNEVLPW